MVITLMITSIFGGLLTVALLFPIVGWLAILCAPFGGSALAMVAGLIQALRPQPHGTLSDEDTDNMVSDLRSVLAAARQVEDKASRWTITAAKRRA
jgi:hypothetical protein